ncbi:MAG TPA: diguanylate cyclase [Polyangia bacterium]|nr:diguanylate cyclase [Polyangia bacterium]
MAMRATLEPAAQGDPVELGDTIERLIGLAAQGDTQELLLEATKNVTRLLGERGSCILLDGGPRIATAPHAPAAVDLRLDLARYPEVAAAIASRQVVTIEDVRRDHRLDRVRHLLPPLLSSVTAVPIGLPGDCLGAFLVQSQRPLPVSAEARRAADLLGKFTALILSQRAGAARVAGALTAVERPAADDADWIVTPEPEALSAPLRVLIVEDDAALTRTLAESLEDEGFLVTTASDGEEGWNKALAIRPALLLLDISLPLLDGFQLARRVRATDTLCTAPIVFLSGSDDLPARVRGAQLDDIDFLRKPFSRDELFARIHRVLDQAAARDRLRLQAQHDELTGLANRRSLRASLVVERARLERYGDPLSVVVFDLDKLKVINDVHGHLAGDAVIRAVADVLRRECRETDLAVRYGGDEFVVLLPHTTEEEAMVFAARTLRHVARLEPQGIAVSVSGGVASLRQTGTGETAEDDVIRRADEAAYRAKRAGGNRVFRDSQH